MIVFLAIYNSTLEQMAFLSNPEIGQVMRNAMQYHFQGVKEPLDTPALNIVATALYQDIDRARKIRKKGGGLPGSRSEKMVKSQ